MTEQTHKILLLGDQAVALGAIHAGLSGVYAYPGTPRPKSQNIYKTTLLPEKGISSAAGVLMKKRPWSRLSACLTWANARWSA